MPARRYNTALYMWGNKEEREASLCSTLLVRGRAKTANPGLTSKQRARGKVRRPAQNRHTTGSKLFPKKLK